MLMPEVHTCAQLVFENEKLKKCLRQLKRQNESLKDQLKATEEQQRLDTLLKSYVTTRDTQVQTDPPRYQAQGALRSGSSTHSNVKPQTNQDGQKLSKMMLMHSNLMKRYEKELKSNMQHMETITELNLKIHELEEKLRVSANEIGDLHSAKVKAPKRKGHMPQHTRPKTTGSSDSEADNLHLVIKQLKKEKDGLAKDKKKLKAELKGLDHGFFEEVEDLKFGLQQSAKLNKEYDHCLRKLCARFGVPHPHPEQNLGK